MYACLNSSASAIGTITLLWCFDVWKTGFCKMEDGRLNYVHRTTAERTAVAHKRHRGSSKMKPVVNTEDAIENHSHDIKPDFNSEQMRTMVGRTTDTLRRTDSKPTGTQREKGKLTAKQRMFVHYIVSGMSNREAYKQAYKPNTTNEGTIASNAHRTASDPKVRALLDASLSKSENALINDEQAMRRHVMEELLKHSREMSHDGHKLKALELMGKAVSMFTDRVEKTVENISTETLKDELSKHLALLDAVTKH